MSNTSVAGDFTWTDRASCRDLLFSEDGDVRRQAIETFFVEAGRVIDAQTLEMCVSCPVRRECLEHSFNGFDGRPMPAGYFAGFSYGQRTSTPQDELRSRVEKESAKFRTRR